MSNTGERSRSIVGEILLWLAVCFGAFVIIAYFNNECNITMVSDYITLIVFVGIVFFSMVILAAVRYGKRKPLLSLILVIVIGLPLAYGMDLGLISLLHARELPTIWRNQAEERHEQEKLRFVKDAYRKYQAVTEEAPVIRPPFAVASNNSTSEDWRIWSKSYFAYNVAGHDRYAALFAEPTACRTLLLLHPDFDNVFTNPNYSWSGGANRTAYFCPVVVTVIDLAEGIRYADVGLSIAPMPADYEQYVVKSTLDPECYSDRNEYQMGAFDAMMDKYLQKQTPETATETATETEKPFRQPGAAFPMNNRGLPENKRRVKGRHIGVQPGQKATRTPPYPSTTCGPPYPSTARASTFSSTTRTKTHPSTTRVPTRLSTTRTPTYPSTALTPPYPSTTRDPAYPSIIRTLAR